MEQVCTIGLDIAKSLFRAHGADATGRELFSKRITPTKLQFFAGQCRRLVAMEACGGADHWAREVARGLVRLRAHATALTGKLPDLLQEFVANHPGVDVEIDDASSTDIIHAVRVGMADIGFVSGTIEAEGMQLFPWAHDEICAVVPQGHELAEQSTISFAELLEHPFIGMQRESALMALFRRQAEQAGLTLRERAHVTGFDMVRKLVSAGLGVSILPRAACDDDRITVRQLAEDWARRPLMICCRDLSQVGAAGRMLIDHLLRQHDAAG